MDSPSEWSEECTYGSELARLMTHRFGTNDVYSQIFGRLGWQAEDVIVNSEHLQALWAAENGSELRRLPKVLTPAIVARLPLVRELSRKVPTIQGIFLQQVRRMQPDVVYFQDLNFADPSFVKEIKRYSKLVVGQIACPLPPDPFLVGYDLIVSSLPNIVDYVRKLGIQSEYLPIAFDSRLDTEIPEFVRDKEVTFVGGIGHTHTSTVPMLETAFRACEKFEIFGYGSENLDKYPQLRSRHFGESWGREMFAVLRRSKVTLNRHIDVAQNYANNMRLYESTGMGALLVTDYKENLEDLFRIGEEILAYRDPDELFDQITWALRNPNEAAEIASRGQARTLQDHSYERRLTTLSAMLEARLG